MKIESYGVRRLHYEIERLREEIVELERDKRTIVNHSARAVLSNMILAKKLKLESLTQKRKYLEEK